MAGAEQLGVFGSLAAHHLGRVVLIDEDGPPLVRQVTFGPHGAAVRPCLGRNAFAMLGVLAAHGGEHA